MTRSQEILKAARFNLDTLIGVLVPWSFLGAGVSAGGGAFANMQFDVTFGGGFLITFAGYGALTAIVFVLIVCHDVFYHALSPLDEARLTPHGPQ